MAQIVTAARLLSSLTKIDQPKVTIENGMIGSIESRGAVPTSPGAPHLDFPGATLAPAFFDVHTHGAMGFDVMEGTAEAFDAIGSFLAQHGVSAYLPTTVTAPVDKTLRALEGIARQIESRSEPDGNSGKASGARPLGIHLEGPFLSHAKRGAQAPEFLQAPSVELLHRFWQAADGRIVLMTVAPELPQALDLIREARRLGIRISLGHSNAGTQAAIAGIEAGACSATHTFNAMRALDHREPGLLGVVLDRNDLYAELICDGIHVDPLLVRLFYREKSPDRGILITDAIAATGMPDGVYKLGEREVAVANGRCVYEGKLAGSVLTLDKAIGNFLAFTNAQYDVAVRYASTNPARMMGFEETYGELSPGRTANIAVLSPEGEVQGTLLNGSLFNPA